MEQWRRGPILGRGSSATVSLAAAFPSGELFALKSADLSKSDLLQNEQRILASINCPQIVSYLGFELTSLHFNLFIEYAPGGSLSDLLKNYGGRLDEPAVQSHTYDLLTGLSYLHYRRIVHCDVKPDNILIGSDGRTKIADLGCARWMDEASNQVKGTPMYMAPEVARGEEQGPAADVWALGCTVLEMLTGSSPWTESDPISTLHNISFSSAVPHIPSWVSDKGKDFLTKCLARDVKQRWTVDQLLKHPFAKFIPTKDHQDLSWDYFLYERSDYFPIDDDPIEILECSNGSEMQLLCSCKTDLITFSNKSNDSVGIMLALPFASPYFVHDDCLFSLSSINRLRKQA